jgi:hypothetical protein
MSSAYSATMPTVQSKKNPATMRRIHSAPGSSTNTTQTGTTTIR